MSHRTLLNGPLLNRKTRLLLACCLFAPAIRASAVSCPVLHAGTPTPAQDAFLHADYDKAVSLYNEQLSRKPNDPATVAELSRVLLRLQKYKEADALLAQAITANAHNALLGAAQADVQLRAGEPWAAEATDTTAMRDDPCEPQVHRVAAQIYRLTSNYASEKREIDTAHQLSPDDPDIRGEWISTLPPEQRIAELKRYLAGANGDDAEERENEQRYLDHLETRLSGPHKSCHLVSPLTATEIPFAMLMYDANRVRAFGLEVKLNDRKSRLEIDTGAGGIYVSSAVAKSAHLQSVFTSKTSGVGDQGPQQGYMAYADSIKVGGLEFRDCLVGVSDRRSVVDADGLIGMDVFSSFLVGLDYPMRKLTLAPLPPRPDDDKTASPTLNTDQAEGSQASSAVAAQGSSNAGATDAAQPKASSAVRLHDRYIAPEMKGYASFYRDGHFILLPTQLNNKSRRLFLLDTGSFATTISPETARELTKVHADASTTIRGISGKVDKVFQADKVIVQFANVRQENDDIYAFDTSRISKNAGMEISGFLGFTTLRLLTIHIDYRDGLVKFDYDQNRGYGR